MTIRKRMFDMETFVISVFTNFISNRLEKPYGAVCSKIKSLFLKLCLKHDLIKLVDQYKNEPYYNSFDEFLSEGQYAENIVMHSLNSQETIKSSLTKYIQIIVQDFIQQTPEYSIYKKDLTSFLEKILKLAFTRINNYTNDENSRMVIVCLREEIRESKESIIEQVKKSENDIVDTLADKIDGIPGAILEKSETKWEDRINEENIQTYKASLSQLFLDKTKYIDRKISDEHSEYSCVDALIQHKKILLLGDPGCGKTYEALKVLEEVCVSSTFTTYIPVYLRLVEYGIAYNSLIQAIHLKLKPYFGNLEDTNIIELIKNRKIVLILDGIDEIMDQERRIKFKCDINEILRYMAEYCLITSRINQYHNDIDNIMHYNIEDLSRSEILQVLYANNIHRQLPSGYYDLFKIPLFLEIGIKVLSKEGKFSHNKSALFNSYIYQLCYGREQEKGILNQDSNFYEMMLLTGKLAFEFFDSACISIEQFNRFFAQNRSKYSEITICDVFRIDIFKIDDGVWFSHKQFKEYFAAYYLVEHYNIKDNLEFYENLMQKESWQEVLIFASGMIQNIEQQNLFFDILLEHNLKTYIESVRYKNDLSESLNSLSKQEYVKYYLETLCKSYLSLIKCYFENIDYLFEPMIGKYSPKNSEVCIVGGLYDNQTNLTYWFDRLPNLKSRVKIIEEQDIPIEYKSMEQRALRERRRTIAHSINLERAHFSGDSAREVAINLVRDNLLSIFKGKELKENNYLLCEWLQSVVHNDRTLKGKTIPELVVWSDQYILDVKKRIGHIEDVLIEYNRIDVIRLNRIAKFLKQAGVTFEKYLLPGPDQKLENGGWIWDLYSDSQKINRIQTFFHWKEISYLEMININFPKMRKYFKLAQDFPFKYKIRVALNKDRDGFMREPSIEYYHLSSQSASDIVPEIEIKEGVGGADYQEVMSEMRQSYLQNHREAKNEVFTVSSFDMVLHGGVGCSRLPLSNSVYNEFKNEVENLFGKN